MKCRYFMSCVLAVATCIVVAVPLRAETSTAPITDGARVTIEMTISVPDEHVMIPNHKSEYIHGARQLIPGLENALTGMHAGKRNELNSTQRMPSAPMTQGKRRRCHAVNSPRKFGLETLRRPPMGNHSPLSRCPMVRQSLISITPWRENKSCSMSGYLM